MGGPLGDSPQLSAASGNCPLLKRVTNIKGYISFQGAACIQYAVNAEERFSPFAPTGENSWKLLQSQSSLCGLLQSCDCITAQLFPSSTLVSFPSSHSCWFQGHSPIHFSLTWNMISMKFNLQQLCWIAKILKIFSAKWRKQSFYQFLLIRPTKLTKKPFDANFYNWKSIYTNILLMA